MIKSIPETTIDSSYQEPKTKRLSETEESLFLQEPQEPQEPLEDFLKGFTLKRGSLEDPIDTSSIPPIKKRVSYIKEVLGMVAQQFALSKEISSGKQIALEKTLSEYHRGNTNTASSYKELGAYNMSAAVTSIFVSALGFIPAFSSETAQAIVKTCAEQTPNIGSMFKTKCESDISAGQQGASLFMDRYRNDMSDKQSETQSRQEQAALAKSTLEALIAASRA